MVSVVLLMAGKGSRMKQDKNKILLPLNGKPIYKHSLDLFLSLGCEVIAVLSQDDKDDIINNLPESVKYTTGGKTRQESVYNGLQLCTNEYVLIHDSARPFVDKNILAEIINSYKLNEATLLYHNVKDTIKYLDGSNLKTLPRSELIAAATPQGGPLAVLKDAYYKAKVDNFEATDDLSLIERYYPNIKINYILSNEENFKITTPLDYELAKLIMEKKI